MAGTRRRPGRRPAARRSGGRHRGRPAGHGSRACPSAPLLAGELRRAGLRARAGPVVTVDRLVRGASRERLAGRAARWPSDMESAPLLAAAAGPARRPWSGPSPTPPQRPLLQPGDAGRRGCAALRSLRAGRARAGPVGGGGRPRQVLLAGPRSFCAGVERAIEIVERALERHGPPVYVRKQIVHNTHVVADLEQRGAIFVDELDRGAGRRAAWCSPRTASRPRCGTKPSRRGLDAIDATCPLVSKVHAEARRFAADGYLVALIGHAGHEEVEGTLGEAPEVDGPGGDARADVARLEPAGPGQGRLPDADHAVVPTRPSGVVGALRERFPAARGPGSDDICYATTNRQHAVRAIARRIRPGAGGRARRTRRTRVRLVETAQRAGTPAYLIDGPEDIELGWLAGVVDGRAHRRGVRAAGGGREIIAALSGLGPVEVSERVVATESIRFGLPKEVRQCMTMPLRQSMRIGTLPDAPEARPPGQVPAAGRARAAVRVQPQVRGLRQDPAAARAC